MAIREFTYELVHPLTGAVARSRFLIHRLFNVRIPKQTTVHFDATTLLLRKAVLQTVTPSDKTALEMGIGQGALLAIGLHKTTGLRIDGVDCSAERVLSSQQVAAHNQIAPSFYTSDLFGSVPRTPKFDLIFFNPPYVPTDQGQQLQLTRRMRADADRVWDGGADGSQVLHSFLQQAHDYLAPGGRILFGAQPSFLPIQRVEQVVSETDWALIEQVTQCCIPSVVYVLQETGRQVLC